ncbi:carbohydrate binding-domain-containing protein [Mycena sanguinolenta]|nr:carbohydrate binding-domain-containing protein [Mycena sanguinolenta]
MARGFSLLLAAIVSAAVAVHGLQNCGSAQYDPSQYTCFNNSQLCPIVNGDVYQSCGPNQCYSKKQYTCFNGNFLCPVTSGGIATQACGNACYSPYQYSCAYHQLQRKQPTRARPTLHRWWGKRSVRYAGVLAAAVLQRIHLHRRPLSGSV